MGKKINQSADNSTKINHMLGFSDKDFKAGIPKMIEQAIMNYLETWKTPQWRNML